LLQIRYRNTFWFCMLCTSYELYVHVFSPEKSRKKFIFWKNRFRYKIAMYPGKNRIFFFCKSTLCQGTLGPHNHLSSAGKNVVKRVFSEFFKRLFFDLFWEIFNVLSINKRDKCRLKDYVEYFKSLCLFLFLETFICTFLMISLNMRFGSF
jgi:hypothetical protein